MKEIQLTQGKVTIVDDGDFEYLNQWKWHANRYKYTYYALRHSERINGKGTKIYMHRLIMKPLGKMQVDHKDRNGLNNQKSNLRLATHAQNCMNKKATGRSKYLGVSIDCRGNITARININNKYVHLGIFKTEEEAATKYDMLAKIHHKEFANLNFPNHENI